MSASEMKCFLQYLPLIIGDLVPENDEVWSILQCLLKIMDILLCNSFKRETLSLLRQLIKEHNEKYYVFSKIT